jgi:hypothetical protein
MFSFDEKQSPVELNREKCGKLSQQTSIKISCCFVSVNMKSLSLSNCAYTYIEVTTDLKLSHYIKTESFGQKLAYIK